MERKPIRNGIAAGAAVLLAATTLTVVAGTSNPTTEAQAAMAHANHADYRSRPAIKLRNTMRKLWEDHIVWTRQFIVSAIAELPDTDTAAGRLLANQDDIGDAVKPFYGDAAGEQLSTLLRDHILIAADLLGAAKAGDSAAVEEASANWTANANEIADFLNAANPRHWPRSEMRSMMAGHLEWTLAEATARLNGDWEADVAAYDQIHRDILHMADMLSRGLVAQFPGRF
ncbi:MAG TPA: hypothetical protein VJ927_03955 [Actinomycetota bacterium]|nr:hypothetical protein [Actinomycetota bacterium]